MDGKAVEFYNKIYRDKPDKWDLKWRDRFIYYVLSKNIEEPPATLMDVGCGNGHTIDFLNRKWPDTKFYGIDFSDEAIRIASERVPNAEFICTTYEEAEVPFCDVLIMIGVLEHFKDLLSTIRTLNEHGRLIHIEVPDAMRASKLKGSKINKEGFRKTHRGMDQIEWWLKKSSWEEKFRFADLNIVNFYPGPRYNFTWLLEGKESDNGSKN